MMDLSQLVRSAQAGDEGARVALVNRAVRLVYGRVYRSLHGSTAAEDVAQEALLKALEALPRLRNPDAFLPWLYRITANALTDHWRSRRHESALDAGALDGAADSGDTADRELERGEDLQRIRAALSTLRPMSRLAIELSYYHELSSREVAYFLGVSDDAARVRLTRARRELKRSVTTMTITADSPIRIRHSTTSSPGTFRGPVFEHDSTTARCYLALYPSGAALEAAAAAKLSRESCARELALLERMGLVVRRANEEWRCTMPVVDDTDMELMRLWAEPIAGIVIDQLPSLHEHAVDLARRTDNERARSTAMTVALTEAARRPLRGLLRQLDAAAPDRGEYGRYSAAVYTCEVPDAGFLSGGHTSWHAETEGRDLFVYYLHPQGMSRPRVEAFLSDFDLNADPEEVKRETLEDAVIQAVSGAVDAQLRQEATEALGIPADRRAAFWQCLVDLQGIVEQEDGVRAIVPTVPLEAWQEYLAHLDHLGQEITARVTDAADGLRRRAARCSFADCYFSDSVLTFVNCAASLVGRAIDKQGWISIPEEADLSWGTLTVA